MGLFDDTTSRAMIRATGADATGTYTPSGGGGGTSIYVDFRNEYEAAELFGGVVADSSPVAYVVTSDLTGTAVNGTLLIGSTTYNIITAQPDGEGVTLLILSEDTP